MPYTTPSSFATPLDLNALGQPIGVSLLDWTSPARPSRTKLQGSFCCLEPLNFERHASELFAAFSLDAEHRMWTYLPYGPFESEDLYSEWFRRSCESDDPLFFAIVDAATNRPVGIASYLRIDPANGSIEVGHLLFSKLLQQTPAATEAMFLMLRQAFGMGYRRYEWKCDALNAPSRSAALRLGFSFEGIFRQAVVYKQRSRDTAWHSIIDREWPALEAAFVEWLAPENFDAQGQQRSRLSDLTAAVRN